MPLEAHDSIREPDDNTTIWRYYSTSQFLWILQEKSLYLSRLDQLDDPFEGYSPVKNLEEDIEAMQDRDPFEALSVDPNLGDPEERIKEKYEFVRRLSLVNCWSDGEEDSLSMWKSYLPSGDGVAIRSTFGNLVDAINQRSGFSYHAGKVTYFDYFDRLKSTDNAFAFIMSKPKQYKYENEIRVFVWWPTSGEVELDEPEPGASIEEDTLVAPTGTKISVDLNTLIDGVYVSPFSPPWSTSEYWNDLLNKYGIEATAEPSQLAMEPTDILGEG